MTETSTASSELDHRTTRLTGRSYNDASNSHRYPGLTREHDFSCLTNFCIRLENKTNMRKNAVTRAVTSLQVINN